MKNKDITRLLYFVAIVIFLSFIGALALTVGRGLDSVEFFTRFQIYLLFGVIGISGIIVATFFARSLSFLVVPLHNPESSLFGDLRVFRDPVLLTLACFILFFPLFFYAGAKQVFFSSIPQQISAFSNVLSDSLFPALYENLLMFIPIIVGVGLLGFYFKKRSYNPVLYYFGLYVVLPVLMGFLWMAFHNLVYSGSESSQLFTFLFGLFGTLITLLSMSFVPWFVLHFCTNFVLSVKTRGLLSSDLFLAELWGVYILVVLLFFYLWGKRK